LSSHAPVEKKVSYEVPALLYLLIIAVLAGMYYYAAFVQFANPEKVVSTYYESYFAGDFKTASEQTSVFQATQLLQQYAYMPASALLAERRDIEDDMARLFEHNTDIAQLEGLSVEIMPEYTRQGKNTAIVVFKFMEDGKEVIMQQSILVREKGRLRIYNTIPISRQNLPEIKKVDMKDMDAQYDDMMSQ
jgi:hypothetical protein